MNFLAYGHDGPGPWILFFPLIWAAVLFAFFFVLRRTGWRGRRGPWGPWRSEADANSPLAVLGRRFATGEIDADEYRRRRAVLDEPGAHDQAKGGSA